MVSKIDGDNVTSNPRAQPASADPSDGPTATTTPASDFAPEGRVIDDSARGTIFWEAVGYDSEDAPQPVTPSEGNTQDWGKPFRIEWMSTSSLPFYRTRGLRNPWNANREVKIARDGTELEPSVGTRLIQMFHRPGPPPVQQEPAMGYPVPYAH